MAQTIKIKRSGSASATPSSLEHGELAINYADGKIYYKNSSNNIVEFTTSASGSFLPLSGGTLTDTLTVSSTSTNAIKINGNTGGLNFTGGNNRIYFNGLRAFEGISSNGNIQIGEGFSGNLLLQMDTEVQGQLSVTDGSASAPAIRFSNDSDTGIYRFTDTLAFTVNGQRKAYVTAAGLFSDNNVYVVNGGQFRTFAQWTASTGGAGSGFTFTNTQDNTTPLTISSSGNAVFAGEVEASSLDINGAVDIDGDVDIDGNTSITGSGSSGNAFEVRRGNNSNQSLRIQNTGEIVTSSNYVYHTYTGGASLYSQGDAVFRASIRNDQSGMPLLVSDDLNITGHTSVNGTQIISSSRALSNVTGNISMFTNDSGYITSASLPSVGNGTLTLATSGTGLSGSASFTANQSGNSSYTVTLTSAENGASKILRTQSNGYLNILNWINVGNTGLFSNTGNHFHVETNGWISKSGNATNSWIRLRTNDNNTRGFVYASSSNYIGFLDPSQNWLFQARSNGNLYKGNGTGLIWHSANDGSGSGLDADTVDGVQLANIARTDVAETFTSNVTINNNLYMGDGNDGYFFNDTNGRTAFANGQFYFQNTVTNFYNYAPYQYHGDSSGTTHYFRSNVLNGTGWSINGAGKLNTRDHQLNASYVLMRSDHHSGHLEGSYNNVGANGAKTNPIYTIGSSYNPNDATLGNMYGVGFTSNSASFINFTGSLNWGMYVAADGDARVWLDGSTGVVSSTGQHYVGSNVVWNAGNDGSGSGLDADTLDGAGSGSFLRSDANDTMNNTLTFASTAGLDTATNDVYANMRLIRNNVATGSSADGLYIGYANNNSGVTRIYGGGVTTGGIRVQGSGNNDIKMGSSTGTAWHSANDGSGSGLDADLLDGQHGSYYLNYNNFSNTPSQLPANGGNADTVDSLHASSFLRSDADDSASGTITFSAAKGIRLSHGNQVNSDDGRIAASTHGSGLNIVGTQTTSGLGRQVRIFGSLINNSNDSTYWHASNDGSGSGLDADTLDGYQSGYFATQGNLGNYLPLSGGTLTGNISHASDLTFDVGGNLILDADGGTIDLMDGGTRFGRLQQMIGGLGISAGSTPTFAQLLSSTKTLFFGHIELGDSKHVRWGNGSGDLQIYHDGSNSYIEEYGTGDLIISSSVLRPRTDSFILNNAANNEHLITASNGSSVFLYHDGGERFRTHSYGGSLTGSLAVSQQVWSGGSQTASTPAYAFNNDTNTGMFRQASDVLGFSCGGTEMLRLNTTGAELRNSGALLVGGDYAINSSRVHLASNGSAAGPSFTFNSDTNTGMFRKSSDVIGFSAGGQERATIDSDGLKSNGVSVATVEGGSTSKVVTMRIQAKDLDSKITGGGYTFYNGGTNKLLIIEEFIAFIDTNNNTNSAAGYPSFAYPIRVNVKTKWGAVDSRSHKDGGFTLTKEALNKYFTSDVAMSPSGATRNMKRFIVGQPRDPVAANPDMQQQVAEIQANGTGSGQNFDAELKIQMDSYLASTCNATFYLYFQVKFREISPSDITGASNMITIQ
jgi:hypothetical protein